MSGASQKRRPSPAVYRRRRLVLIIALLAIIAVVWLLIAQPWSGSAAESDTGPESSETRGAATELPAPDATADGSTEDTPSPSATAGDEATNETPPAAPACKSRDIAVEALTDQDTYGSGQNPQLSIRLTNNGSNDCTLNVGTTTQIFTITSGSDTWWRSTDCQTEPSDMIVLLAAGQSVSSATPLTWDRTRSAVGTCGADASRPSAPGGGASYHLAVEIGGIPAAQTKQILLY